jgi:hypothetical protein
MSGFLIKGAKASEANGTPLDQAEISKCGLHQE